MRMIRPMGRILVILLLALVISPCWAAQGPSAPAKVAVLPFTMHTPADLAYLQDGVRDMLASRLAWQDRVQVLDRTVVNQALQGVKSDIPLSEATRIGKALKADYVLFGSLTALGQSISIDAKMVSLAGTAEPVSLYVQTRSLDEVIPKVNQFAQDINQKLFARPGEQAQAQAADGDALANRNPELLIPDAMLSGDRISYLNPNFIEVTPEGSLRQSGLWRSQTFQGGIMGMDIGDLDNDRRMEMVVITANKLSVFRREGQGLKTLAVFEGDKVDRYLWVSVVDVDRDGSGEIYVTNLRKRNLTRPGSLDTSTSDRGFLEDLSSFGLTLVGGKLQISSEPAPYFLNGVDFPGKGKVLLGQQKGSSQDGPFAGGIYEMHLKGKSLAGNIAVSLPSRCNVFNFARADINNDHAEETVLIDASNRMLILNSAGDMIWKSDRQFAATTNSFEGKVNDRRFNDVNLYAIPSPILIADLNKDGIVEIVVNRSTETLGKFMPEGLKYYDKGEIVSLSWDQLGLVENWKTREISGMVTSIRMGDVNHDGTIELATSLVLAKDFLKIWDAKSTIFSYDLSISPSKTAAKQ